MTIEQPVSDFFTAGGTLPPDAPSYVKRPTDDELYRHIMAGEFCYVLTPRQMGKSSLMIRTAQRLVASGVRSATVDLTRTGTVDEDQWYKGILTQIKSRLRLSVDPVAWWEQRKDIPNIQKFIEFFEEMLIEVKEPVVIFIDEIDTTLKLDFRDDFFAGIRAMFNARAENPDLKRVTFVLLGVASPSDLIKDRNRTPFNIGQEIPLRPFSREDAGMLEKGLEESYPNFGRKILDRIFYWTNGHPYLTQKLCQSVVETQLKEYSDNEIDLLVKNLFTSEEASRETNLQFVRDNVLSYPERRIILSLYKKILRGTEIPDNKNSLPQNHLKLSGLARIEDGKLVVSNKIYSEVFNRRWVNKYTEVDWRYPIIVALSLVIIGFAFVFYNDGVRLPNQAATRVNGVPIYRDDRGIGYLADLFQMKPYILSNEYEYKAKDVFFNSFGTWEEQKALIEIGYGEPHPSQEDYEVVVTGLYTNLVDVDNSGQTTKLLDIMHSSLKAMGMQDDAIYQEIGYWMEARNSATLADALAKYTSAIDLNPKNPATLFERARIYAQLGEYENSLIDYEQVIAIVPESNVEPTEGAQLITQTPTYTQTLIATLTKTPIITSSPVRTIIPSSTSIASTGTIPTTPVPTTSVLPPTNTPVPSATNTATPILAPDPIQPRFLTRGQLVAAVKNDINQNENLVSFLSQAKPEDYPNLVANGFVLTATPSNTQPPLSSTSPSSTIILTPTTTRFETFTPTAIPQINMLLQEDFEDGKADGWGAAKDTDYVGNWIIEQDANGNHYWSGTGPDNYPQNWYGNSTLNWSDYAFESRIQFITGGTLFISLRSDAGTTFYTVFLNGTEINYAQTNPSNYRELTVLNTPVSMTLQRNKWYTVRVEIVGNTLSAYVDNVLSFSRTLPTPLVYTQGGIGYYMGGGEKFYIDDIRVWSLNETSTPSPLIIPTDTPSSPRILVSLSADSVSGKSPLTVKFDARSSYLLTPGGIQYPCQTGACHYTWIAYLRGQQPGKPDTDSGGTFQHTFRDKGSYIVTVQVCWGKDRLYCSESSTFIEVTQ